MSLTLAIHTLCLLVSLVAIVWRKSPVADSAFTSAVLLTLGMGNTGWIMWFDFIFGCISLADMFVEIHLQHELRD